MAISLSSLVPPKTQLWFSKGDSRGKWESLERRIKEHPFNYAVEIFIPRRATLPTSLSSMFLNSYFARTAERKVVGLSLERRVDIHNVFAVLPTGKLILSVNKDTFEELGLQGTNSRYQKHRFLVAIDLMADSFKPGRPGYERTVARLKDMPQLQAKFILSGDRLDSQSQFAADFHAEVEACKFDSETLTNFSLPVVDGGHPDGCYDDSGTEVCCSARELYTWLGGVACGLDVYDGGAPGDYVTTFNVPEPHVHCEHGARGRWTGLITSGQIWKMVGCVKECLDKEEDLPWAAVSVWGFEDAPVSWKTNEHGWLCSGDNHFTLILFRTGEYWTFTSLATHDIM